MTPQAIEREVQLIHGMLRWATRKGRKALRRALAELEAIKVAR